MNFCPGSSGNRRASVSNTTIAGISLYFNSFLNILEIGVFYVFYVLWGGYSGWEFTKI